MQGYRKSSLIYEGMTGLPPVSGGRRRWTPLKDRPMLSFQQKARVETRWQGREGPPPLPPMEGESRDDTCGIPLSYKRRTLPTKRGGWGEKKEKKGTL
jgi:hypothetical protein